MPVNIWDDWIDLLVFFLIELSGDIPVLKLRAATGDNEFIWFKPEYIVILEGFLFADDFIILLAEDYDSPNLFLKLIWCLWLPVKLLVYVL